MGAKALITGISGQDGSYLAEFLLNKGYEVHGIIRRSSSFNTARLGHLYQGPQEIGRRLILHYGDMADAVQLTSLIYELRPREIFHLGGQSHVRVSFEIPEYTADVSGLSIVRILEAIRKAGLVGETRIFQACGADLFGGSAAPPQSESTPFLPDSPHGCAKLYAASLLRTYRESYGVWGCNGILFNHESPRRGETFVGRKITRAAARIKLGLDESLYLGNLTARRDWGFAGDYVEAMWMMLQTDSPADYVVATGESQSVADFCQAAFELVDLDWKAHVRHDARYERPTDIAELRGDSARIRRELGWEPRTTFADLVRMMVEHDLVLARRELAQRQNETDS
jgi:GDPmannose 4,6-dehydratase